MSNNSDFKYIRDILNDGKFELSSVYEHGLSDFNRFHESFGRLSDKFSEAGFEYGADKFKELAVLASSSRFDTEWKPDNAVFIIAEIWNYIGICSDRLNFYEILDEMNEERDEERKA